MTADTGLAPVSGHEGAGERGSTSQYARNLIEASLDPLVTISVEVMRAAANGKRTQEEKVMILPRETLP